MAEMKAAATASQVLVCSGHTSAFHCGGVGGFAAQGKRSGQDLVYDLDLCSEKDVERNIKNPFLSSLLDR